MADLSELVITGAQKSAENLGQGFNQGAELALKAEQIQSQKAKVQQDQQALMMTRYDKLNTFLDTASKMPDGKPKQAYVNKFIPNAIRAFGLENQVDPTALEMAQGEPVMGAYLKSEIEAGRMTLADVTKAYSDPNMMAKLLPDAQQYGAGLSSAFRSTVDANVEELSKASKFATEAKNTQTNARIAAQGQFNKQKDAQESEGDVTLRNEVAKEFGKYRAMGGKATLDKTEAALTEAIDALKTGKVKTGGLAENAPYGGTTPALTRTNKPLKALRDRVLSTQNIKALSGDPNPTERQIEAINSRILDPAADPKTNIKNLQDELDRVRSERALKEQSFIENRFMSSGQRTVPKTSKAPAAAPEPTISDRITAAVGIVKGMTRDVATQGLLRKGYKPDEIEKILKDAGVK